ncbi:MAG: hypothetical protein ABIR82_16720 [Nocardioides sp.]
MNRIVVVAALGQLVGLLGWIDPLFIALALAAPLITGGIASARRIPLVLVSVLWFSAGINMLWTDWVVNREDVLFHLALSVLMPVLAGSGYGLVALVTRRRARIVN